MSDTPDLSNDELLSTTRAVRKRLDLSRPVPVALLRECSELAQQAPTGSNTQGWHFVFVTDATKRARLAELYRAVFAGYRESGIVDYVKKRAEGEADLAQVDRVTSSAEYLAEHLHEVPVHLIPCIEGRADRIPEGPGRNAALAGLYGSILPAVWSFMLAARARGLGTAWTTMHLEHEQEAAELLGIPYKRVMQTALIPVAYTQGTDFKPARRRSLEKMIHVDAW